MIKKTDEELLIENEMKKELEIFRIDHGRSATSKDKEFWEISERYKEKFSELIAERKKEEKKEEKEKEKLEENPVATGKKVVTERFCETDGCDNIIVPTGKRGRPAKKCENCRSKK